VPQTDLAATVGRLLDDIQSSLLQRATEYRDGHIHEPAGYDDFKQIVADGWAFAWWCGRAECEASIKEETRATTRCIPLNQPEQSGDCIYCGRPAKQRVYFARAY